MKLILFIMMLAASSAAAQSPSGRSCHDATPCHLDDRSYHIKEPDGWDGVTPLPVLIHFHGWAREGGLIVKHQRISGATRRRGVLLVAPNGRNKTWRFRQAGSPDSTFARAVIEDVQSRYPIREDQIFVSGYSWGANMAWRFVCEDGEGIAALLAISGTLSQTENCTTSPSEVRQVYGLDDQVLRFPMGPGRDETYPVQLWREAYKCNDAKYLGSWQQVSYLTLERTVWEDCAEGRVSLDLHPGGHFIPHGWIARQLDELLGLKPSYP